MLQPLTSQLISEMRSHPFTLVTVITLVAFCTWGWTNFARAADINGKIGKLENRMDESSAKIDRLLALQIAEAIRAQHRHTCQSEGRKELLNVLDRLQDDYKEVHGTRYALPDCDSYQT